MNYLLGGLEPLVGSVEIALPSGKKLEHLGVKIELIGQIDLHFDRANSVKFLTIVQELEAAGTLTQTKVCILLIERLSLIFNFYHFIVISFSIQR